MDLRSESRSLGRAATLAWAALVPDPEAAAAVGGPGRHPGAKRSSRWVSGWRAAYTTHPACRRWCWSLVWIPAAGAAVFLSYRRVASMLGATGSRPGRGSHAVPATAFLPVGRLWRQFGEATCGGTGRGWPCCACQAIRRRRSERSRFSHPAAATPRGEAGEKLEKKGPECVKPGGRARESNPPRAPLSTLHRF